MTYQSPALSATLGLLTERAISALVRRRSILSDERRRSSWTSSEMADLLASHGFQVRRDDDLLSLAKVIGSPVRVRRSLRAGRLAVADR
jgi:hypothetical protein